MDSLSAVFVTFGAVIILIGWVQLLFTSFAEDYSWGLTTLFLPPLSYIYGFCALDKAKDAMIATVIGWLLVIFGLL